MNFVPRTLSDGSTCCSQPYALCGACSAHHSMRSCSELDDYITSNAWQLRTNVQQHQEESTLTDYTPPNPYERGLRALMTPEQRIAGEQKATQFAAIAAAANEIATENATKLRALKAEADLGSYAAPNGYQIALDALGKGR